MRHAPTNLHMWTCRMHDCAVASSDRRDIETATLLCTFPISPFATVPTVPAPIMQQTNTRLIPSAPRTGTVLAIAHPSFVSTSANRRANPGQRKRWTRRPGGKMMANKHNQRVGVMKKRYRHGVSCDSKLQLIYDTSDRLDSCRMKIAVQRQLTRSWECD